jgi:hypothetical protein
MRPRLRRQAPSSRQEGRAEGAPLGALLQRLIGGLERVAGVSEATMAAVKKIVERLE